MTGDVGANEEGFLRPETHVVTYGYCTPWLGQSLMPLAWLGQSHVAAGRRSLAVHVTLHEMIPLV